MQHKCPKLRETEHHLLGFVKKCRLDIQQNYFSKCNLELFVVIGQRVIMNRNEGSSSMFN